VRVRMRFGEDAYAPSIRASLMDGRLKMKEVRKIKWGVAGGVQKKS